MFNELYLLFYYYLNLLSLIFNNQGFATLKFTLSE